MSRIDKVQVLFSHTVIFSAIRCTKKGLIFTSSFMFRLNAVVAKNNITSLLEILSYLNTPYVSLWPHISNCRDTGRQVFIP